MKFLRIQASDESIKKEIQISRCIYNKKKIMRQERLNEDGVQFENVSLLAEKLERFFSTRSMHGSLLIGVKTLKVYR